MDAVLDLVTSGSGCSRFRPDQPAAAPAGPLPAAVIWPVEALLGEISRRQHLLRQMSGQVTADTVVRRNARLESARIQVSALQWALLIRAGAGATPRELALELGHSVFGTTAEVYRLMTMRLLSAAGSQARDRAPGGPPKPGLAPVSFIRAAADEHLPS